VGRPALRFGNSSAVGKEVSGSSPRGRPRRGTGTSRRAPLVGKRASSSPHECLKPSRGVWHLASGAQHFASEIPRLSGRKCLALRVGVFHAGQLARVGHLSWGHERRAARHEVSGTSRRAARVGTSHFAMTRCQALRPGTAKRVESPLCAVSGTRVRGHRVDRALRDGETRCLAPCAGTLRRFPPHLARSEVLWHPVRLRSDLQTNV
jgi:hypothetical protein